MFGTEILEQLKRQSVDELVNALERIHSDGSASAAPGSAAAALGRVSSLLANRLPVAPPPQSTPEDLEESATHPPSQMAASSPVTRETLLGTLQSALGEYEGLLRRYNEDFDRLFSVQGLSTQPDASLGEDATQKHEDLVERLRRAQQLLFKFPIAAQALFGALVTEGRRFSQTPEGGQLRIALSHSDLLRNVRTVLGAVSQGMLRESPATLVPSALVDLIVQAASSPHLEATLNSAFGAEP